MEKNKCRVIFLGIFLLSGAVNAAQPVEEDSSLCLLSEAVNRADSFEEDLFLPRFKTRALKLGTTKENLLISVEADSFCWFQRMKENNRCVRQEDRFLFYIRNFVVSQTSTAINKYPCLLRGRTSIDFSEIIEVKNRHTIELKTMLAEKLYEVMRKQLERLEITPPEGLIVVRSKPGSCAIL